MNCTNRNHHVSNEESCVSHDQQHQHNHHEENNNNNHAETHYHFNKMAVKGWFLNCVYFSLHAVQIYLILKLV
jgi:hypothetical protein